MDALRARRGAEGAVLTILGVSYPLAPVGSDSVGGAEQILASLDHALVAAGHRSIVIAPAGSQIVGTLVSLPIAQAPITRSSWIAAHEACRAAIRETLAREHVDLVHLHGIDFHAYLPAPGPVVLATLHLPLDWYPPEALHPTRPGTFLHGVSRTQVQPYIPGVQLLDPIENGVDLQQLRPQGTPGEYALVLGRICPEKGQHLALDAATRSGVPVVLAGQVFGYPEHEAYFREQIAPRLHAPHRFIGRVTGDAKACWIAGARCVIVPSVVDETSSLVAMEALACGTPVIAFRRGAIPELVEDGVTGWLVADVEELARALRDCDRLDRARCRAVAEARCSRERMSGRYLARYEELVAQGRGKPVRPGRGASRELRVEVVDRVGLETLEPAWAELWTRCNQASTFQRPEWCLPWCRTLLAGEVESIAVWNGGVLDGLLPLFRWSDAEGDTLSLIGAGMSDYQDLLMAPGAEHVARALVETLRELAWDRLELSELRDGSPLLDLPIEGAAAMQAQEPCPALPLTPDAPLAAVAPKVRHEIEYQRRRAAREIGIEHVVVPAAELVDRLAWLHRARWAARGQDGVLTEATRAFLADAIIRLSAANALVGVGVGLGGELAAIAVGFLDRDRMLYYLGGFDPRHERRSPGTLAIAAAMEEACRRGARVFDFLRGAESYKYRFGARDHVHLHRRVIRRVPCGGDR